MISCIKTWRLLLSIALSLSLIGCQTIDATQQADTEAELRDCIRQSPNSEFWATYCTEQYGGQTQGAAAATETTATDPSDSGSSGLWWKIPLLIVAVPLLIVAYAYTNKGGSSGFADSGRYKGYKTYDSTYSSPYGTTHCRTQLGGSKSYTSCN